MWHVVQQSNIVFDRLFTSITEIPYTFSYLMRKRMQIDSWMELPKEKRPPQSIWDDSDKLEEWFERLDSNAQTDFNVGWDDNEVEQ